MSWKDDARQTQAENRPVISTSPMHAGDSVTLTFEDEGETFESEQYGEGVRFDVIHVESDARHTTDDGSEIAEGEEARVITWSNRLLAALATVDTLEGNTYRIVRLGTGYDTQYDIEQVDDE